jgi:hypothetical protein
MTTSTAVSSSTNGEPGDRVDPQTRFRLDASVLRGADQATPGDEQEVPDTALGGLPLLPGNAVAQRCGCAFGQKSDHRRAVRRPLGFRIQLTERESL